MKNYIVTKDKKSGFIVASGEQFEIFSSVFWASSLVLFFAVDCTLCFLFLLLCQKYCGFERAFFYTQAFFTLHSFAVLSSCTATLCFHQGFPGSWQSCHKDNRASYYDSKQSPGWTIPLNHMAIHKSYIQQQAWFKHVKYFWVITCGFKFICSLKRHPSNQQLSKVQQSKEQPSEKLLSVKVEKILFISL